jgi:DNA-binding response OmpR family regulator
MSGYPADLIREKGLLAEGMRVLAKPLVPRELVAAVRAGLASAPRGSAGAG